MRKIRLMSIFICLYFALALPVLADSGADYVVQVKATAQTNPATITLSWTAPTASNFIVYKKNQSGAWVNIANPDGSATTYVDTDVVVGNAYEYRVAYKPVGSSIEKADSFGYIYAGIEKAPIEERGKLILVVDNTMALPLAFELERLERDLEGDGYTVVRHDVSRTDTPATVKSLIVNEYQQDPQKVKSVLLFGHIPVIKSGNFAPDGHAARPWPADVFYGDMNGTWTDANADGVYDHASLPSDVELQVGRVDMWNLPLFFKDETELLREYLNKDHTYRTGNLSVNSAGLVGDKFGYFYGENFRNNGWGNFGQLVDTVQDGTFQSALLANSYVWSHANGGGTYTSVGGTYLTSQDFGANKFKTVFIQIFGSYNGEWSNKNNLLRSAIAMDQYGLTSAWTGRPNWFFHHMAMGEAIGYSAQLSQNNAYNVYKPSNSSARGVHVALLGDPTLRMYPVKPPSNITLSGSGNGAQITWTASPDSVLGYYIYKSAGKNQDYTRITSDIITQNSYTDTSYIGGYARYMVRAVKLQSTPSGTFYNLSQGTAGDARWNADSYTVAFDSQGGTEVDGLTTGFNTTIAKPADPIKTDYTLFGWYREAECINPWNFTTDVVTGSMTLFAKWVEDSYPSAYRDHSLASLSYTIKGVTTPITLSADDLHPAKQENRYNVTLPMITKSYTAQQLPVVSAQTTNPSATLTVTQATVFPGTAKISVTAENGITRNYYVRFRYAAGNITNVVQKIAASPTKVYPAFHDLQPMNLTDLRELYYDVDTKWQEYCGALVDRGVTRIPDADGIGYSVDESSASKLPSVDIPLLVGTTGQFIQDYQAAASKPWATMWIAKGVSTNSGATILNSSPYFEGASWITPGNDDKTTAYMVEAHDDAITFEIDRSAWVWIALSTTTEFANFSNNGWTRDASVDKRLYHGEGSPYTSTYRKHYNAGEMVKLPTYGVATGLPGRMYMVFVVWDAPGTGDASLKTLSATYGGTEHPIEVVSGQTAYRVIVPSGNVPVVNAILNDATAEVDVFQASSFPGTATVNVLSGGATAAYTVEFDVLSADTGLKAVSYTHPMMGQQTLSLNSQATTHQVVLPYGISAVAPLVTVQANHVSATIESITQPFATPGSATVVVRAEDGSTATHTINFTVSTTLPTDPSPGIVTEMKTRYLTNTAVQTVPVVHGNVYAYQGSKALPSTKFDATTGYVTTLQRTTATMSSANLYFTADKAAWAFGDRIVTTEGTGAANNVFRGSAQNVIVEGTSPIFIGDQVTKLLLLNNEKDVTVPVSDFYSFTISKGGTVYLIGSGTGYDDRYTGNGWTKDASGLKVIRGSNLNITGDDGLTYSIPNGGADFLNVYYKRYCGGANVTIPNRGTVTSSGLIAFVVWDKPIPAAPAVTADDIANVIIGLDTATMEYAVSVDGGVTYGAYTSVASPQLGGSKRVKVRYKAQGQTPAGIDAVLSFTTNAGDINGDGQINIADVVMAAEIAVGYTGYTPEQTARANVSSKTDVAVDISDVVLMIERLVGGTTPFPIELP